MWSGVHGYFGCGGGILGRWYLPYRLVSRSRCGLAVQYYTLLWMLGECRSWLEAVVGCIFNIRLSLAPLVCKRGTGVMGVCWVQVWVFCNLFMLLSDVMSCGLRFGNWVSMYMW